MTDPVSGKALPGSNEPSEGASQNSKAEEMDLIRRARLGEMGAYDTLVRRYQERIYATLYHMTSNHEDANDLAQEAFIKAYRALQSFRGDSAFYTWLYRIAINTAKNALVATKRRPMDYDLDLQDPEHTHGVPGQVTAHRRAGAGPLR